MSRLKERYKKEIRPALRERFKYVNPMQVPTLKKVVLNMGIAAATQDRGVIEDHQREMTMLSGQKPIVTHARMSVAGFKLREGQAIGLKVTLRGKRMYEFVDRFLNLSCPRIRDFRGFPSKCDGHGNYSLGIDTQEIFYEVDLDKMKRKQGMHVTFVTSAEKDEEAVELLRLLGVPFKKEEK